MANLTFSIKGKNANPTQLDVDARQFKIVVDEPEQLGGTDNGANPVEYLLAGYAGCLNVVTHLIANERGVKINKLTIEAEGDINPARFLGQSFEDRAGFKEIRVKLKIESESDNQTINDLIKAVEQRCPINDNLLNTTPITITLQ